MTDLTDAELLEYIASGGSDEQRERVGALLEASPEIRARYDELAAVHRLLGQVDCALPEGDLWPQVAERLRQRAIRPAGAG